jgi:hypothetical protein
VGAVVRVFEADVSDLGALDRVFRVMATELPPLRGVFHAAAVLDDGTLLRLDPERFARVLAPKVAGAWHLHQLTLDQPLEFFVLFSSAASLLGSPGQGNYAAANAFLDALAHYRRTQGRPALSINWGPWADVGLAAARPEHADRLATRGMSSLQPDEALDVLGRLLTSEHAQVGVLPLDVRQWCQSYPQLTRAPFFAHLLKNNPIGPSSRPAHNSIRASLAATDPDHRLRALEDFVCDQLAHVLRLHPTQINKQTLLGAVGLDSLMLLELRHRLEDQLELRLPTTAVAGGGSVSSVAIQLAAVSGFDVDGGLERAASEKIDDESEDRGIRRRSELANRQRRRIQRREE